MKVFYFNLSISPQECFKYYRGDAQSVTARDVTGKIIQFPAHALRPFIRRDGVSGRFELRTTDQDKFIEFKKIK